MAITEAPEAPTDPGEPPRRSGRRAARHEPLQMLAYIEQHEDGFEVVPLEGELESRRFATLPEAAAFIAGASSALGRGGTRGVLAWIS